MTTVTNPWLDSLLAGHSQVPAGRSPWLNGLRAEAFERAGALTVPTMRDEDWRFTDLSPLYKLAFRPALDAQAPAALPFDAFIAPDASWRAVFVDGAFAPALSRLPAAGEALAVANLADGMGAHEDAVRARLGKLAPWTDDAFRAINTCYLHDGALVVARRNAALEQPVQLLFVSTRADAAVHPRVLVVAEPGADVLFIEDYVSLHDGTYCTNTVTEIEVGENARVRHVRLQRESRAAFHIATCGVRVARDGTYRSSSVAAGGRISRLSLNVTQAGENAHVQLDGLALIDGRQLADTHTFMDHARPHGASRQLHKCIVGGNAHAVFNGRVLVRPGAQQTDSAQENRNLLLTGRAHVDTKPQLEIFADDVKCSHGATVGQLDAEELFYVRSRGLSEVAARNLLTFGFAAELVDRIPVPSVVAALRQAVLERTQTEGIA